jgi:hypothetical protein
VVAREVLNEEFLIYFDPFWPAVIGFADSQGEASQCGLAGNSFASLYGF